MRRHLHIFNLYIAFNMISHIKKFDYKINRLHEMSLHVANDKVVPYKKR